MQMERKEMISIHQFTVLVILITIGEAILVLPAIVAANAKQDAWLSTILALAFGLLVVYLFIKVGNLYPKLSLVQYNHKILGKWFGSIASLFFFGYLFLSIAAHLRELGDFISAQILPYTPIQVIHLMFILIIIMGVRSGLETIARTSEILAPIVFLFLLTLFIFILPKVHFDWVQPILENGMKPVLQGTITATAFPFMELVVFLMIIPHINQQEKVKKGFFIGAAIGGVVLIMVVLLCILVLGEPTTARKIYPTYTLARSIHINGSIQRIEGLIAILWTITTYLKITLYSYALHIGLVHFFKLKGYRMLTFPFGMILFAAAMLVSPNISYFIQVIGNYWPFYDMTVAILLPLILVSVFTIRKRLNTS